MTTILTKKKDTTGAPAPGDLTNSAGGAELAVNTFDKRLYTKDAGGNVVEIGTNPSIIDTTTVDTTNLEVTNIKAKDGTASATIANSTGIMTIGSSVLTTTDINGGTIDGTVIGGASAAAGNFTTLGATGVATFSAGTVSAPAITTTGDTNTGIFFPAADTIAFTEGGVESMRIDSAGDVGIGTTNPVAKLHVVGGETRGVGTGFFYSGYRADGTTRQFYLGGSDSQFYINVDQAVPMLFTTNATERMRIHASGGVSIGNTTDSGAGVLNVNSSILSPFAKLIANGTGSSNAGLLLDYSGVVQWQIYPETTTGTLTFTSAGTNRLKLDTSGNLGLGVTPNATWTGSHRVFQFGTTSSVYSLSGSTAVNENSYNDGTNKYLTTNFATRYLQASGQHIWFNAPSGTAGNAITFTQAMTLDASGRLGVGTASPAHNVDVVSASDNRLRVVKTGTAAFNIGADTVAYAYTDSAMTFRVGGTGNGTERMRINTSGDAFINCSTSQISTVGTGRLNIDGSQGLFVSGYGDAIGFGSVYKQSASAVGNNGWPVYFVSSAEAQVGGVRQRAASVEYLTTSSATTGAILLSSGVEFPATQVASANANTLDDYEEGTWTPNVRNANQTSTFTVIIGKYIKIGKQVTCWCSVDGGVTGAATGNLTISGLPFVYETSANWLNFGQWNGSGTFPNGAIVSLSSVSEVYGWSGGGYVTEIKTFFTCSFTYIATA